MEASILVRLTILAASVALALLNLVVLLNLKRVEALQLALTRVRRVHDWPPLRRRLRAIPRRDRPWIVGLLATALLSLPTSVIAAFGWGGDVALYALGAAAAVAGLLLLVSVGAASLAIALCASIRSVARQRAFAVLLALVGILVALVDALTFVLIG